MSTLFQTDSFQNLLSHLASLPCEDSSDFWPAAQLTAMAQAGVTTWDIPPDFAGLDLPPVDMLEGLRQLASASLVATFVLTQRTAAVRRIATSDNTTARQTLLPALCRGDIFATVGISHLTTSGQHLDKPLVGVHETESGFELSGLVPWSTGATQADILVTGGTLDDGRQILTAIPTDRKGLAVQPPMQLMAMNASQTGAVRLDRVQITADEVLHGPIERVMSQGTGGGAGSLGTSALAMGAAGGTLHGMRHETDRRPELLEYVTPLQREHDELLTGLRQAIAGEHPQGAKAGEQIRQQANSLVMRSAQAWLAATKGAGYVAGHPAERAVRESMFFLVWSCPQPVLAANLQEFACPVR
ncbi:MAG: acyl-CoA/acyl-ACP dehydrogenase [Planctomycetaceae bacterium]|nr:acyl-CoA/acyl-ACP dehydrogenase [Planctomycetaceae bacterium]